MSIKEVHEEEKEDKERRVKKEGNLKRKMRKKGKKKRIVRYGVNTRRTGNEHRRIHRSA